MKEHNGAELNTQTVGMPNPPSTQQFDARGEIWSANMRPLMISSARLKINVDGCPAICSCVVFFSEPEPVLGFVARFSVGATKHMKGLTVVRCTSCCCISVAFWASLQKSVKRALCYFSFCVLSQ